MRVPFLIWVVLAVAMIVCAAIYLAFPIEGVFVHSEGALVSFVVGLSVFVLGSTLVIAKG